MSTTIAPSVAPAMPPAPIVPQRRRRDSVEVIDVDQWNDDRPTQRRRTSPDVIDLVDSDVEEIAQPVASGSRAARREIRRRYFSPPPSSDFEVDFVPPVPAIPGSVSSFPRRPLPHPTNPILANPEPFSFEALLARPRPREVTVDVPRRVVPQGAVERGAAGSNMRMGGAIISNSQAARRERTQALEARRQQEVEHGFRSHRRRPLPNGRGGARLLALNDDYGYIDLNDFLPPGSFAGFYDHLQRLRGDLLDIPGTSANAVHYKTEYTHPKPPQPGFTFDFAPSSDPSAPSSIPTSKSNPIIIDDDEDDATPGAGPSQASSSSSTPATLTGTLICAHCNDALVMGVPGGEDEERKHRLWALRCGHMIDGKCADLLSMPSVPLSADAPVADRKGKSKAVDPDGVSAGVENPIRSRLRSHQPASLFSAALSKATSLMKRKGKAKLETYQWACPVEGCGRMHTSVKNEAGEWGPDKTGSDGIIGVFV